MLNGSWFFFHCGFGKVKFLMVSLLFNIFLTLFFHFRPRNCWQLYRECCISQKSSVSIGKWFVHSVQIDADFPFTPFNFANVRVSDCWSIIEREQTSLDSCFYTADCFIDCQRVFLHLGHQATERKKLRVGTFPLSKCPAICIYSVETRRLFGMELGDHFCSDLDHIVLVTRDDALQLNLLQHFNKNARDVACTEEKRHQQRDIKYSGSARSGFSNTASR